MRNLVKNVAGWLAVFYLMIFFPAFVVEETRYWTSPDFVYIGSDAPRSIYSIEPQYAAYGVNKLDNYPDQIFILDGSTAVRAFDPRSFMQAMPAYKVHNLAINGSNITEIGEMADLVESRVALKDLHSNVFVLCGQFSTFLENRREFHDEITSVGREKLRHHLYRMENGQIVPSLPEPVMGLARFLVQPFIALYTFKFNIMNEADALWEREQIKWAGSSQKAQPKQDFYTNYWNMVFEKRGYTDGEFIELEKLANRLKAEKATVIYIDLPVPGYIRNDFFAYAEYRRRMKKIAALPSLRYVDMTTWAPDGQFVDDSHPLPKFYAAWSAEAARRVKNIIGGSQKKS